MTATEQFKKWAKGYAGCSGGDMGSPERRTIWVCGIEWGAASDADSLKDYLQCDVSQPPEGDEYTSAHLKDYWQSEYNRNTQKILSVINGGKATEQRDFYESVRPFTKGAKGYFKLNFLPISFPSTSTNWPDYLEKTTGFKNKSAYIKWCKEHRAPQMREWARMARPRMILCFGTTLLNEFKKAFHEEGANFVPEDIADRDFWWSVNSEGVLVVITPFPTYQNGAIRDDQIQQFGERIAQLLKEHASR